MSVEGKDIDRYKYSWRRVGVRNRVGAVNDAVIAEKSTMSSALSNSSTSFVSAGEVTLERLATSTSRS